MPVDLTAASREQHLVLFDPAAIPADAPVDPDMLAQEPKLMPRPAMMRLASSGDALILHIPTDDCEARLRVFAGEEPPEPLRRKGAVVLSGARLRVPSGRLRADGLEFLVRPGEAREHSLAQEAEIPAGHYGIEVVNLQGWKARNRLTEGRRGMGAAATAVHRLVTVYTWLGILLLFANIFVAPMILLWFHESDGWSGVLRAGAVIAVVDAVGFGGFWVLQAAQKRLPILSRVGEADAVFERENPDIIVILRGLPPPSDTVAKAGAAGAAEAAFAQIRFV
jgi:hypothetical protein